MDYGSSLEVPLKMLSIYFCVHNIFIQVANGFNRFAVHQVFIAKFAKNTFNKMFSKDYYAFCVLLN